MFFEYPSKPHVRRHGPAGYTAYTAYKPWLRDEFVFRCAYCLVRERWYPNEQASFSTDHFIPQIVAPGRVLDYDNLVYACTRCNSWKQDNITLNPCQVAMGEFLRVNEDGTIEAMTPEAVEHVQVLGLDDSILTKFRRKMIRLMKRLEALPDERSKAELREWFGFPDDLPNLAVLRPRRGNTRPEGVAQCYYERRRAGELPELY